MSHFFSFRAPRVSRASLVASPLFFAALFAPLLALWSSGAQALFDDDEARKRIEQTNARLTQIETQLNERLTALEQQKSSQALLELSTQLDAVRGEVAQLRGQIEVLTYELNESKRRQRDLYTDLDSRLARLESGGAMRGGEGVGDTSAGGQTSGQPAARDEVAEQKMYDAAMEQFKRGDYGGAATAFTAFTAVYPQSPLASSAQYWIGNARFAQRDYKATIAAQTQLLQKYPDSTKAPDAMLNLASAQAELGDKNASRKTLQDIVAHYPNSDVAAKARQRLR
ncbi:MAG: tol-pal system protein YbgF [Burkholderiales bacterium]|jgi:tol-pal system protein YbgF|nr:tol-pal system protein YbgF [Burkholderiales bacterium]